MAQYKLFNYMGNKDLEMPYILPLVRRIIKAKNITTIVEPFGGSFSLIRHLIDEFPDLHYHVNDADITLIKVYQTMIDENKNKEIIEEIKKLKETITKEKMKALDRTDVASYLFGRLYYQISPFFFPYRKTNINYERIERFTCFKDVLFTDKDYHEIFEQYKGRQDVLLFLDPPLSQ